MDGTHGGDIHACLGKTGCPTAVGVDNAAALRKGFVQFQMSVGRWREGYIGDTAAIEAHYINRYFPAEQYYERTCCPRNIADCVIEK